MTSILPARRARLSFVFFLISALAVPASALAQATPPAPTAAAPPPPPAPPAPAATPPDPSAVDEDGLSPEAAAARARREPHSVSVTFSPLHFLFPELKVMVEGKVSRKFGVAAIGGFGMLKVDDVKFTVWEAGAQAKYYLVGSFQHGMEVGAQAEYVGISASTTSTTSNVTVLGSGGGLGIGPFLGYKLATKVGFTCDLQAGVQYLAVGASAVSSSGSSASASETRVGPIVNLHIGWSF